MHIVLESIPQGKRATWVDSGVGEEDGQFVNIESTSISTWIYPDGYTSSLVFLLPPRRGDGGG